MIKSMTGFGSSIFVVGDLRFTIEARAVNHRHLDVRVKVPRRFSEIEQRVVAEVQKVLSRGKIDVTISSADAADVPLSLELNEPLAGQYHAILEKLREKLGLKEPIRLESFVALRDVVFWKEPEVATEAFWEGASRALGEALGDLSEMRMREGEALNRDLEERLSSIGAAMEWIGEKLALQGESVRTSLREKVKTLLEGAAPDPWRMEQEILFYTERMDTSEELTRLASHLAQFRLLLESGEGPVGRKLDFLLQEMMRESNTINAKAGNAEIVHRVVEIKAEVEKIREQVQNVE